MAGEGVFFWISDGASSVASFSSSKSIPGGGGGGGIGNPGGRGVVVLSWSAPPV